MVIKGGFIAWSVMGDPNSFDSHTPTGDLPANVW
jgi:hypothetical protein